MIRLYKEREFSIPSAAGKIAIDETRILRRRGRFDEVDLAEMSWSDMLAVCRNGKIREAVTAPPERRTDVTYPTSETETREALASYREVVRSESCTDEKRSSALSMMMGALRGKPMRCVAPRRAVAPIVKLRPTRGGATYADSDVRAWRDTVTNKLARIRRDEERALLLAEDLRSKLIETTNRLAAKRSETQRSSGGRRRTCDQLSAPVVLLLEVDERRLLDDLSSIENSTTYSNAIDNLLAVCTVSREVEEYCFRMAA